MTDEITVAEEAPAVQEPRRRFFGRFVVGVVLLAMGFAGGLYWERSGCSLASLRAVVDRANLPAVDLARKSEDEGQTEPAVLEARLTEQIRSMHSEIARLDNEAKEGRIHYNLLLQRGYGKGDDVCVALVARQDEIKERIAELQVGAREAEALRYRLTSAIKNQAKGGGTDRVDEDLRTEVLRVIHRANLEDSHRTAIPDAVWKADEKAGDMERINGY